MSVGLIDNAGVACNGVTGCSQTNSAAKAIPIAPVEKNSLRIVASFVFANLRTDNHLVTFQNFAVASQKWFHRKICSFVRMAPVKYVQHARAQVSWEAPEEIASQSREIVAL